MEKDSKAKKNTGKNTGIGISDANRKKIARGLEKVLANSYVLYIKTHNFHWNVTGPLFVAVHELTERQYTELAVAVDVIAERIRALGMFAPGSGKQFVKIATIEEETGVPTAKKMIQQLVADQEEVVRTAREVLSSAERVGDQASADLLTERMSVHEKNAWMLGSLL